MPRYSNVQFVAWEVYTGPVRDMLKRAIDYEGIKSPVGDRRWDILSQCVDISARIEFTERAIALAYANADPSQNTLKIFMAPEFLYRGGGGAYVHDLINGWSISPFPGLPAPYSGGWGGLFGGLKDLVADDKFNDWIFVFGTAVSAFFQVRDGQILAEPQNGSQPAQCINSSLIQCGGALHRHDCYVSQKHLKSAIDFITLRMNAYTVHRSPTVDPFTPALVRLEDNMTVTEGGAVFAFRHIQHMDGRRVKFGIEICLDHIGYGANTQYGRLRRSYQRVDIQLVPSGGMVLQEDSISLLPLEGDRLESYAFNCDGLCTLVNMESGAHVQLWNQLEDNTCTPLVEIDNGSDPNDATHFPILGTVAVPTVPPLPPHYQQNAISGESLWASIVPIDTTHPNLGPILLRQWPSGPGFVRVLVTMPLNPSGPAIL